MQRSFEVVRRLFVRLVLVTLAATVIAGGAAAADRRIITTDGADYPGFDLSTLKDVTLPACEAACLADNACQAFTFNTRANWCFLKSDFGALASAANAVAGRVVASVPYTPTLEQQRLAEVDFLPREQIDDARTLVGALPGRYGTTDTSYGALRDAGGDAYRTGNYDQAAAYFGQALALASDDAGAWLDYAVASLARNPDSWSDRWQASSDAGAGALNAYLRADNTADQAEALAVLAGSLGERDNWRPAIRSYRASLALNDVESVRAEYDRAVAEHGFRILSHEVEADSANPQICLRFSDPLPVTRPDLADFVTVEGGNNLSVEPQAQQICVNGVEHGGRYTIRVRAGLPSADGETIEHPLSISVYIRDRSPWVGFAGNAYVLPAGPGATIPISSVNADTAKATIYRIGDRSIAEMIREGQFLSQLSWYSAGNIADGSGEQIWEGEIVLQNELNQTMTTAIPISDAVPSMAAGVYVITAKPATSTDEYGTLATQWFLVSDLGLATLSANDGIHAFVRSLSAAEAVAGARVRLVAVNNDILGEAVTDADGRADFGPGLARGTGGLAAQQIVVETGTDYAFIDLTRAAFDLSDRGVAGRPAPGALDVFLTPERGIYRPGETIYLTALVRDARANFVGDLPLTLVVERPDGVEFLRRVISDQGLGGYSDAVALQANAMRGAWRIRLFADPKGAALAETSVLVEDFEPERLALTIDTQAAELDPAEPVEIELEARYLYGAPAIGLFAEGEAVLRPTSTIAAFPGYTFGLADDPVQSTREPLSIDGVTDEDGKAQLTTYLPQVPSSTKPFDATLIVRVADTNGRAIERTLTRPVKPAGPMIGIKPLFDGDVEEGARARFEAIYVDATGARAAKDGVTWKLERLQTDYQWYRSYGSWSYELITNATRVDSGTVDFLAASTADARPAEISAQVDWGRYRLTVESADADGAAASSVEFYAGWYQASASSTTPDTLQVALDKPAYAIGDTAKLRLDPRFAGIAVIEVLDDRLIAMQTVAVPEGGTTVDLAVTEDWGPGAYVTATLYRPMDIEAKRMPARAIGLSWAKVSPGDRDLDVALGVAGEIRPRGAMTIPVTIGNLAAGEDAYVTVAAVDVGILNLTNFQSPAPDDWYFGQRELGAEIRDIYGLLIDRTQGVLGAVRSGGDSEAVRLSAPPPTQKLLAYYSGVVKVDDEGKATVTFDIPDFNGTVRVMAMAWSAAGIGHAAKDVIVRDPVVVTSSIPRFLLTGDTSRLLVEIDNVAGPAGDYTLEIATGEGIGFPDEDAARIITLAEKQKVALTIPISADAVGDFDVFVSLTAPSGEEYPQSLVLGIRPPGEPVTRRSIVEVAGNGTLTLDGEMVSGFVPGTASVAVSLGGAGPLDVAGILAALDRYPYGCTEQLTSRAMPLVYLDEVAMSVGLGADAAVRERVQKAIYGVLANQSASGSFGLWGPDGAGRDLWLDAYVTDFLTRAADHGYDVPELARTLALDNLANRIAYASDFDNGGEEIAYALYVLARTGRAAIGDLRYYADSKLMAFRTALAKAQIGAALALYGDNARAQTAFAAAMEQLDGMNAAVVGFRPDFGTTLRDEAAVLTLAAESGGQSIDLRALATRIAATEARRSYASTQENAWMLMAAAALIQDSKNETFAIDGETISGPLFRRFAGEALQATPVTITNLDPQPLDAAVAATGVPVTPEPAGGNGFTIARQAYTPEGEPIDLATVGQNERYVIVLTVTSDHDFGGHLLVVDPIPAGFEIENPDISASGDTGAYGWLSTAYATHTEARTDRFVAALDRDDGDATEFSVAYSMRAVSPGVFAQPGATVEDMYRPELNARTGAGTVEVVSLTR